MDVQTVVWCSRVVAAGLAGVALLMMACGAARWRPGQARRFCPGVRVRGMRRLSPARALFWWPCGYDLSGLPQDAGGAVCCPECGRELRPAVAALRSGSRRRPERVGIAVMLLAAVVVGAPMLKTHRWQRFVPTTVLIGMKRTLGSDWTPTRLRRELDRRIERTELSARQVRWVLPALQRDLRADRSHGNAYRSLRYLGQLGEAGRAALERSLKSKDRQERHLAASQLRYLCWDRTQYKNPRLTRTPSDELLRVTVEGLASDGINYSAGTVDNAWDGFDFLVLFPEQARPLVADGLRSGDHQQRILCAALVAQGGNVAELDRAIPVLLAHLAADQRNGNARLAAKALAWIGPAAEPSLVQLRSLGDPQQRAIATVLLRHLRQPPTRSLRRDLWELTWRGSTTWDPEFGTGMGWLGEYAHVASAAWQRD